MTKKSPETKKDRPCREKQKILEVGRRKGSSGRGKGSVAGGLPAIRLKDPMLERERAAYDHPLPSREYILAVMTDHGKPISSAGLAVFFEIAESETIAFDNRLRAMARDGQILLNRRGHLLVPDSAGLIEGRVVGHRDGYGFFVPTDGSGDLFLTEREMRKVLPGDRVLVRKVPEHRGVRTTAKIVEVTQRTNKRVVGRLFVERKVWFVVPEDQTMPRMLVSPDSIRRTKKWRAGVFVTADIVEQPTVDSPPVVSVTEWLGEMTTSDIEVEVSIRRYELPFKFSKAARKLAFERARKSIEKEVAARRDLRDLPLVTIDSETARDFDDAVYGESFRDGHRLVVAIADVSHYVRPGDTLDVEAYERGNSVYFPSRVLPMLPEELSTGICSLNPDEDRLAMVCDMSFDQKGELIRYRFYPSTIRSKARLTYETVHQFLEDGIRSSSISSPIARSLSNLKALYRKLALARQERGSIDFELPETQILFGEDGKIESIVPTTRNEAHRLIEECMLAANVCAAHLLSRREIGIYRVHETPSSEKLDDLRRQLSAFGLTLKGGDKPTSGDFAAVLSRIQAHPNLGWMQMLMLRSLPQAVYSSVNLGHFALAYPAYTHFTSPIRRYSDLIAHRLIKAMTDGESPPVDVKSLEAAASHCSVTERRADSATRDAVAWLKCEYMHDKIGQEFAGTVSSVVAFGLFVLLDDLHVEGLVHVSALGKDYFEFDADRCRMIGRRSGFDYRVGDRLTVKLISVNLERRQIDFSLTQFPGVARRPDDAPFDASTGPVASEKDESRRKKGG